MSSRPIAVLSLAFTFAALVPAAGTAAVPPPRRGQDSATVVLDRASAAYGRLRTARGTFEQTLTNPLTRNSSRSRGEYQLHRASGRWALDFTDPRGDRIVDDGTALWVYVPSTNPGQVIKLPSAGAGTGMDLLQRFFGDPASRYRIADGGATTVSGRSVRAVALTPLVPMEFTRATVWIEPATGTLRQFEVTEPSGLVRRFTFTTVTLDGPVNERALRFSPPRGVRVFDQSRRR